MEFWNNLLTEKSWEILQNIKKEEFNFILIGGWATYLWAKQHKSKDIDFILPDLSDLDVLKKRYNLIKNDNLKKYEIKIGEIDIDIYVPYYSKLSIPLQDIKKHSVKIEGFDVVSVEILVILKQGAEIDRGNSIKGQKDRIDIMSLLYYSDFDFKKYNDILEEYKIIDYKKQLIRVIKDFNDFKSLNIDLKKLADFKKKMIKDIKS